MSRIPNPFSVISKQLYAAVDHLQERRLKQEQLKQSERQLTKLNKELLQLKKRYNSYRHEEDELEADLAHVRNKSREVKRELLQLQKLINTGNRQLEQLRCTLLEYSLLRYGRKKGEYGIRRLGHYTVQGVRFLARDLHNLFGKRDTTPQLPQKRVSSRIESSKSTP